jgi:type IV pilus assembly protein PilP
MIMGANKLAWLIIALCLGGSVWAEDKIEAPAQKSKEAVDKLKAAPTAVGKTLQDLGKSVGAKLGLGQGEAVATKTKLDSAAISQEDKEAGEAKPAVSTALAKRDPFRPFTLNSKPSQRRRENLSPLERYDLGQLKLVGVIWDTKQPNAMVEDSAGLGYVVKVGTPIGSNEGKVKSIQPARLVIEEFQFDVFGAKKKVERSMRLEPEKAD